MTRVTLTIESHIAHVQLARPEKLNAVDLEMRDALIAVGEEVAASEVRACVLSGQGRGFCAGVDLEAMQAAVRPQTLMERSHGDGTTNRWQEAAMVWTRVPVPVIAAVHGTCFGAGLQIALGADIRIASPDAKLALMEVRWGLVPDMGAMVLLPRLVRGDVLRRLTYSAAPVSGKEAAALGFVTELAEDPLAVALALAREIADKSPAAIRAAKRLIGVAEQAEAGEALLAESAEQAGLIGGADQMEIIAAHLQKRVPVFK